jgi:nucleoredoxin
MVVSGKVLFCGENCWQVVGLTPEKNRIELFFNVSTGQWSGLEYNVGPPSSRMKIEIRFRNFQNQDGIITPFQIIAGNGKRPLTNAILQNLEFNPKIESDEFKLPSAVLAIEGVEDKPVAGTEDESGSSVSGGTHGRLISMIGPEIVDKNGSKVPSSQLSGKKDVLLYFSASWCPPCKRFTPGLVEFFKKNAPEKDFTIIFVSSDRSQDAMMKYMKDYNMDFWAVPFDRVNPSGIKTTYGDRGIPNLVWLNAADQPVAKSYVDGNYVGPAKVLAQFGQSIGVN